MDPATIVTLIGSSLTATTRTIKNLHELSNKFNNAAQTVQLLIAKLSTIRTALTQLQVLLESKRFRHASPQLRSDLVAAMHPCTLVMLALDKHICQIQVGRLKGKLRFVWDEGILRDHSTHLDSQISALSLLLQVIQLSSAQEQRSLLERRRSRRILRIAQDDASSYLSKSNSEVSSIRVDFEFDDQLMQSNAYRAALQRSPSILQSPEQQQHAANAPSQGSTCMTNRDLLAEEESLESIPKRRATDSLKKRRSCSILRGPRMLTGLSRTRKVWVCSGLFALAAVIIILVIVIPRKLNPGKSHRSSPTTAPTPTVSNFPSGFPTISLSLATISRLELSTSQSGCVFPETHWSCAVPPEQQAAISPNQPDEPNVQFEVIMKSGTSTPVPAPPSTEDQLFLGNTTDDITAPFNGADTPFLISFQPFQKRNQRREPAPTASTAPFTSIEDLLPSSPTKSDGFPADASLLPLPTLQPLHIYNQGLDSEHYGFYTYFDRAIFLRDNSQGAPSQSFVDTPGGSTAANATTRCMWTQTRFHVQIWTKNGTALHNVTSSAFSLPMTITLDRHGGNSTEKMVACYGLASDGRYNNTNSAKTFVFEDRAFGGVPVNLAQGSTSRANETIDGGTGGCQCAWTYTPPG